jgi:acyl carrier protein
MELIIERILKILAENSGRTATEIKDEDQLEEDLGFDELDYIVVMMALEEEFGIRLDDEKFDELKTVQQVIDHIAGVCTTQETAGAA